MFIESTQKHIGSIFKNIHMSVTSSFHNLVAVLVVVVVGATKVVAVILSYSMYPHRFRYNLIIPNL